MFREMHFPRHRDRLVPKPVPQDINNPCPNPPHCWAHMGRPSNTRQHVEALLYKQRKDGDYVRSTEGAKDSMAQDLFSTKFDRHAEHRRFQGEIKKRLQIRLEEYERSIDIRREKLKDLLAKEEREFYRETIDVAQRGGDTRMETMKKRASELIAKREAENEVIVRQKRVQQYMQRCLDLREALSKKNTVESKNVQLQQMRENEARREAEREIESMWHDVTLKEIAAKKEREEYDALDRYERDKSNREVWDMQIQANKLLKEEQKRIAEEDKLELVKVREQLRKEQIEALIAKRQKRIETDQELRDQIATQERLLAQRHKEEQALEQAYTQLALLELEKEKEKMHSNTSAAKREMQQYMENLRELEREKNEEERKLNELLTEQAKAIQAKQDAAKCRLEIAKKKLQEEVLKERSDQLKYKQEIAEQQLQVQQAESELLRMALETNKRLEEENARQEKIARQQYQTDLLKQIEHNKMIQEKEKEELERQLAIGCQEEEKYQKLVAELCAGNIKAGVKHPFRKAVERHDCHCTSTRVNPPY